MLEFVGKGPGDTGARAGVVALGGQGHRPERGGEFGMDFAHLLQAAQDTHKGEASGPRLQETKKIDGERRPMESSEESGEVGGRAVEEPREETAEEAEEAAEEEEMGEDYASLGQQAAAAVGPTSEFVPLDAAGSEDALLEEDVSLEGASWKVNNGQMRLGEGVESGKSASAGSAVDELEGEPEPSPQASAPPLPSQGDTLLEPRSSLDLLSGHELLDPDLVIEEMPAQFVERLQQAMGAGNATALADDVAEVVMPQVIRGMAALVRNGTAEMRLQLQPPDLGEIELRVRTTEATVRGEMMVQRPEIKQLLDGHMDRLRNALAGQGLELEGFDVSVERDAHFAQDGGSWQREEGNSSRHPSGRRPAVETPATEVVPAGVGRGDHAVDYTI